MIEFNDDFYENAVAILNQQLAFSSSRKHLDAAGKSVPFHVLVIPNQDFTRLDNMLFVLGKHARYKYFVSPLDECSKTVLTPEDLKRCSMAAIIDFMDIHRQQERLA